MLHQLLQHVALNEPRTWLFVAAAVACGVAGWYCADVLSALLNGEKG